MTRLHETLGQIAQLEEQHKFLGVGIQTKEHSLTGQRVQATSEEVADYVLVILQRTAELSQVKHSLPVVEEYAPQY